MAFTKQNFEPLSGTNLSTSGMWIYKNTDDTIATITAANYFDLVINQLSVKDVIWVVGSDEAKWMQVSSVTTHVTLVDAVLVTELPLVQGSMLVGSASGLAAAIDSSAGGNVLVGNDTTMVALDGSGDTKVLVGNGTTMTSVALSGDVTMTNAGVTTIGASSIDLAMLSTGITPSHVVKYAGKITWSGSGASLATTVTGVLDTDIVIASIQTVPTQAAYLVSSAPTTNTITNVLSAANTSNDAVISYTVFRAAT